jgi:hypothetical protein
MRITFYELLRTRYIIVRKMLIFLDSDLIKNCGKCILEIDRHFKFKTIRKEDKMKETLNCTQGLTNL